MDAARHFDDAMAGVEAAEHHALRRYEYIAHCSLRQRQMDHGRITRLGRKAVAVEAGAGECGERSLRLLRR